MKLPPPIRSASHPLARQVRALQGTAAKRHEQGLCLIEGPRGLETALSAGAHVVWVLISAARVDHRPWACLLDRCQRAGAPVQPVQEGLLERIAPTGHGQGLLAAARIEPAHMETLVSGDGLLVVLDGLQDPGNVGSVIRSAAAFGAQGVVSVGGADPWGEKAVRASAGTLFALPVARAGDAAFVTQALAESGFRRVAAVPRGGDAPARIDWNGRVALLLGSEAAGLSETLAEGAERVSIPIEPAVESLSVPIAGALLLFCARLAAAGAD